MSPVYIVILCLVATMALLVGYGVIPWQKKGAKVSREAAAFMKRASLFSGYAMLVLAIVYALECLGLW